LPDKFLSVVSQLEDTINLREHHAKDPFLSDFNKRCILSTYCQQMVKY